MMWPYGNGPATDVMVTVGSQSQAAIFPDLGYGNTTTLTFDVASDPQWTSAAPGTDVSFALTAVSSTKLPTRFVIEGSTDPNFAYPACYAASTALSGSSVVVRKPSLPPTTPPTPPATEPPTTPPTTPPVTPAAGGSEMVGVPVLGLPGLLMMGGLLLGVGWRALRSGVAGRVLSALVLVAGVAWLAAAPHQSAQAQMPSEPCTPTLDALTDITYALNGTTVTVTVTRRYP